MAVTVSHGFSCAIADDATDAAAGKVLPSHWNATHTVANALDKTGDTMTGALAINLGTITVDTPAWNVTQTWNAGGVTFTGLKLNVTSTASAAGSLLVDLQVATVSQFAVTKVGQVRLVDGSASIPSLAFASSTNTGIWSAGGGSIVFTVQGLNIISSDSSRINVWSGDTGKSTFFANQNPVTFGTAGTATVGITANASGVLEVNSTTVNDYRDLLARYLATNPTTVASLPAAAAGNKGWRSFVTDANSTTFLATAVGGGANNVPVVSNGTNWVIG